MEETDNTTTCSIINDFGFKAFDLELQNEKIEISNVMEPLDKWYIRKALRKDFKFILNNLSKITTQSIIKNKNRSMRQHNGIIEAENCRLNIVYTFVPISSIYYGND